MSKQCMPYTVRRYSYFRLLLPLANESSTLWPTAEWLSSLWNIQNPPSSVYGQQVSFIRFYGDSRLLLPRLTEHRSLLKQTCKNLQSCWPHLKRKCVCLHRFSLHGGFAFGISLFGTKSKRSLIFFFLPSMTRALRMKFRE